MTPRDRGNITTAVIEKRGEGAVRLWRVCPPFRLARRPRECGIRRGDPPLAAKLNQGASHNNKGRRRRTSVAIANLKKETGTLLKSVMKTAVGF
jgi:hypothetical protein